MSSGPYDKWGVVGIAMVLGSVVLAAGLLASVGVTIVAYDLGASALLGTMLGGLTFMAVSGAIVTGIALALDVLHDRQTRRKTGR